MRYHPWWVVRKLDRLQLAKRIGCGRQSLCGVVFRIHQSVMEFTVPATLEPFRPHKQVLAAHRPKPHSASSFDFSVCKVNRGHANIIHLALRVWVVRGVDW